MKKRKKNRSGVSLLELIVVIAVIGILAAIAIISMSPSRQSAKIESAQLELASEINLAKAYALQGKIQNGTTPCGYGVTFTDTSTYVIFYNKQASGKSCEETNAIGKYRTYNPAPDVVDSKALDQKKLPGGITIKYASPIDATVYFTVPNGTVFSHSSATSTGEPLSADKDMELDDTTGQKKFVRINPVGMVSNKENY